jgi:hypothetical protein
MAQCLQQGVAAVSAGIIGEPKVSQKINSFTAFGSISHQLFAGVYFTAELYQQLGMVYAILPYAFMFSGIRWTDTVFATHPHTRTHTHTHTRACA